MHLYYVLVFCSCLVFSLFCFPTVHSFFYFSSLVSINKTERSTIPACPSLMCSFNKGKERDQLLENLCLMFVYVDYVCIVLCLYKHWFCGLTTNGLYIYERF